VSSAKDAKKSDNIISFWNIPDDCHVISKVPAVDTEVDPPQQMQMSMNQYTDLLQKALRLRARSFYLLCELTEQSLRTMTLQPISKKSNTTCCFPAEAQGRGVNTPPALCNKTAHTDDRINLSQSSRSSQRPRPVIGEILKKSRPFIIGRDFLQNVTVKLL
jgi:hypothetical protein